MKKLHYLLLSAILLLVVSCSENIQPTDVPGNIAGMGNTPGNIETLGQFTLPDGIVLGSEIRGSSNEESLYSAILKSDGCGDDHEDDGCGDDHDDEGGCDHGSDHEGGQGGSCEHGSGGQWVSLDLTFVNTTDLLKEIALPAGLVFECEQENYQHGILLQEVMIKIKGRGAVNIKLNLYCLNKGLDGSDVTLTYQLRGIASSKHMGHLTTKLEGKKIDIIHFNEEAREDYEHMIDRLQDLVWAITNNDGINEDGWAFVESIPDLLN